MTNQPTPQPPNNNDFYRYIESFRQLLNNPGILNIASRYVFISNFIIFASMSFMGFSTVTLVEYYSSFNKAEDEYTINRQNVCNQYIQKARKYLKDNESLRNKSISKINDNNLVKGNNDLVGFYCQYDIENNKVIDKSIYFYMVYNPVLSEYIHSSDYIELEPITLQEMRRVCRNEKFYKSKIFSDKPSFKENIDKYKIDFDELKLVDSQSKWKHVIPAFRWKCVYNIKNKDNIIGNEGQISTEYVGLNLDEFVCKKYKDQGLIKAIFLNYRDPYSLHCAPTKEK